MDQSGEGWLSAKLERNEYIQKGLKEREGHFRLEKWLVPKLGGWETPGWRRSQAVWRREFVDEQSENRPEQKGVAGLRSANAD